MLKIYRMPNGHLYQFEEAEAPAGAELCEPAKEEKAKPAAANKAKTPKTKKRG